MDLINASEFGKTFTFKDELLNDEGKKIGEEDLNDLLKEFDSLNCKGQYKQGHKAINYLSKEVSFEKPAYCSSKIKEEIFDKLPKLGYSPVQFNSWIIHHIYEPLAYRVDYNYSYISILS